MPATVGGNEHGTDKSHTCACPSQPTFQSEAQTKVSLSNHQVTAVMRLKQSQSQCLAQLKALCGWAQGVSKGWQAGQKHEGAMGGTPLPAISWHSALSRLPHYRTRCLMTASVPLSEYEPQEGRARLAQSMAISLAPSTEAGPDGHVENAGPNN